jgi:antitoxin component YwqK of YwqJK toxin-antitoxin module
MKLISTINKSIGFQAKVYYNNDYNEYVVKYYDENKKIMSDNTFYYTDDKDDALCTAYKEIEFMSNNKVLSD